jgi:arsenate reductase-like glutaredoxin family protein
MSCKTAQGFLESNKAGAAKDMVNAGKEKLGRDAAIQLAKSADKVVTGKGKTVTVFDMKKSPPGDDALAAALLGPTGNLRAPTLRVGKTLLVGFSEKAYRQVFGG